MRSPGRAIEEERRRWCKLEVKRGPHPVSNPPFTLKPLPRYSNWIPMYLHISLLIHILRRMVRRCVFHLLCFRAGVSLINFIIHMFLFTISMRCRCWCGTSFASWSKSPTRCDFICSRTCLSRHLPRLCTSPIPIQWHC